MKEKLTKLQLAMQRMFFSFLTTLGINSRAWFSCPNIDKPTELKRTPGLTIINLRCLAQAALIISLLNFMSQGAVGDYGYDVAIKIINGQILGQHVHMN